MDTNPAGQTNGRPEARQRLGVRRCSGAFWAGGRLGRPCKAARLRRSPKPGGVRLSSAAAMIEHPMGLELFVAVRAVVPCCASERRAPGVRLSDLQLMVGQLTNAPVQPTNSPSMERHPATRFPCLGMA